MNRKIFALLLIFFTLLACKEKDTMPPSITILSPTAGTTWEIGTDLPVQVKITDDKEVSYARIVLHDEDSWAVGTALSYSFSDKSCTIHDMFPLPSDKLKNGLHKLTVTAGDGYNEVYKSVLIKLTGEVEKEEKITVITANNTTTNIYAADTAGQFALWKTLACDFLDAKYDPDYSMLYIAPKSQGKLFAINVNASVINWELPILSTLSQNWFQGIEVVRNNLYVGDYGGSTNIYDRNGYSTHVFTSEQGYVPKNFFYADQNTFIYSEPKNTGLKSRLTTYNVGMALLRDSYAQNRVVSMFRKDDSHLLLFSNSSTGFAISSFYWLYGNEDVLKTGQDEKINDIVAIDSDLFLVATNQSIYRYNSAQNSLLRIMETGADCIGFDPGKGLLLLGKGSILYYYDYNNNTLIFTLSFSDEIVEILKLEF